MPEHSIEPGEPHPAEWREDLNPDFMAGQPVGRANVERETDWQTAYDVKSAHRSLAELSDDDLKAIPIVPRGSRLQQGSTYVDLHDLPRGEFTATGDMEAVSSHSYVPKNQVPYEVWNRLVPERVDRTHEEEAAGGEAA